MRVLVALGLVLALAACKTTGEKIVDNGGHHMSKTEVTALLSNTTKDWDSGEGVGYFAPDGEYIYTSEKHGDGEGQWSVRNDGTMCMKIEQFWGKQSRCNWDYYRRGDGSIAVVYKEEKTVYDQTEDMYMSGNRL
jgi:hypothetical protein